METAIRVENLSKRYIIGERVPYKALRDEVTKFITASFRKFKPRSSGYIWALKNVSFEVKRGEVVGIIGRNGAGKTTLLRILSRITEPTEGYAEVHGRVGSLLEVGTGFHPELTGRENIYLNGSILGMRKAEINRKFDEIAAFAEIEKFIDTPVKHYSSGMYVRLAFAVAAHLEPEILLVDEVLAVGDFAFQKKCLGKMEGVAGEGRTVLFVSHQMEAVSKLCKRSILISNGKIEKEGQTDEIISHYVSDRLSETTTSLMLRKDRMGDGRLRFTETWVEDINGNRALTVPVGGALRIVAAYEVKDGAKIRNLETAFAISTIRNIQVADLANATTNEVFTGIIPEKGRVECLIPKVPLNIGTYYYNVIAKSGTGTEDWVQHAGKFNVGPGDYFGTGKMPDSDRLIMIDHRWEIKGSDF